MPVEMQRHSLYFRVIVLSKTQLHHHCRDLKRFRMQYKSMSIDVSKQLQLLCSHIIIFFDFDSFEKIVVYYYWYFLINNFKKCMIDHILILMFLNNLFLNFLPLTFVPSFCPLCPFFNTIFYNVGSKKSLYKNNNINCKESFFCGLKFLCNQSLTLSNQRLKMIVIRITIILSDFLYIHY